MKTKERRQTSDTSRRPNPKSDSGFSLVEVTLALAVIGIGLIAILGLLPQGLQSSRDAADQTMAATVVQDMFSQLRALPFTQPSAFQGANLNLSTYSGNLSKYFDQEGFQTVSLGPTSYYAIDLNFAPVGSVPATSTKVTATVRWRIKMDGSGGQSTNVFVTQVSYYDVP